MKKTSEQWKELCNVTIMDPDGWDRQNFDFSWKEELITKQEFEKRIMFSTCRNYSGQIKMWKDL